MRHHVLRSISCFGIMICLGQLVALPAAAQHCTDSTVPGTLIGFTPLSGVIEKPNSCNLLPCYKPEEDGGAYPATDENCDALSGSCPVQLRVPLKFPGNSQMPTNAHVRVYWFDQAMPDEGACLPPPLGNCSPISVCGPLGAEILVDKGETWIQVAASCDSISSGQYTGGTFSLSAYACQTFSGECTERLDVPGLALPSPDEMWDLLGCGEPPPPCNKCFCKIGPSPGSPGWSGPGAHLRYLAKGAGHPGFPGSAVWTVQLGRYWSHDYAERIVVDPDDSQVWLITREAGFHRFSDLQGGVYQSGKPSDEYRRLARTADGWELTDLEGSVQSFGNDGLWLQSVDREGNAKVASYAGGVLTAVSFTDGRSETFTYHADGKLESITEVGVDGTTSRSWLYTWDGPDLTRIDRPDGSAWSFRYDEADLPGYMTRMTLLGSSGGERVEGAWEYDARGNVLRSWRGDVSVDGPDAVERYSFSHDNPFWPRVTEVVDPLGQTTVYELERDPGGSKPRLKKSTGDCGSCGLGPDTQLFYDDPAHPLLPTRRVDARGTVTLFAYDAQGRVTSRTEAMGTALERTTTWEYDSRYPALVTEVERASTSPSGLRRTSTVYDAAGRPSARTISGIEDGNAFNLTTTYQTTGLTTVVDPPGFGAADQVILTYDPARGGQLLQSRTDPRVGTTSYGYDALNRRTQVTAPDGLVTETGYDALSRVSSVTRRGASAAEDLVTTHVYNEFGDLWRRIFPEGNVVEYGYDPAGRVISIERKNDLTGHGDRIAFVRNGAGHKVREDHQSWNGSGWDTESFREFVYASRCRLEKIVNPDGSARELGYDCNGNLEQVWDANHPSAGRTRPPTTVYGYDVLDRLISVTQPWSGAPGGEAVTVYGYDVQDHLVEVTDAEGNLTRHTYSDRDLLTAESSVASGLTRYAYNEHGELIRETDARDVVRQRTVDELDRVTFIDFPGSTLDTTYVYDDPTVPFSKGRLTAILRDGARIDYRYDRFGRTTLDGAVTFSYDRNGNRREILYPGGLKAVYSFDFANRPVSLALEDGATSQVLVASASYKPTGPLASLVFGNGLTERRGYDQRYDPTRLEVPQRLSWAYVTDAIGNVTSITDDLDAAGSRTYEYQDISYYLTRGAGAWGDLSWTYDKVGNRLSETRGGVVDFYDYASNAAGGHSPRLTRVRKAGGAELDYAYDAAGELRTLSREEGKDRYVYDAERRLAEIRSDSAEELAAVTRLSYDGRGFLRSSLLEPQPAGAAASEAETVPSFSTDGLLHHKSTVTRPGARGPRETPVRETETYVFRLGERPVAILEKSVETLPGEVPAASSRLLYLTTDHLGTPVLATDAARQSVWKGGFEPFGADFSGAVDAGVFLRLPGQWQDPTWAFAAEALSYNLHRWYHPELGRYSRPDPLGLLGGIHPFRYGRSNPVGFADPLGLAPKPDTGEWCDELPPLFLICDCDQDLLKAQLGETEALRSDFCEGKGVSHRSRTEDPVASGDYCVGGSVDNGRAWYDSSCIGDDPCQISCTCKHEQNHADHDDDPHLDQMIIDGKSDEEILDYYECLAYGDEADCLKGFLD